MLLSFLYKGLRTALIAVGASVGGLCFLMLMALLGMCRYGPFYGLSDLHKVLQI